MKKIIAVNFLTFIIFSLVSLALSKSNTSVYGILFLGAIANMIIQVILSFYYRTRNENWENLHHVTICALSSVIFYHLALAASKSDIVTSGLSVVASVFFASLAFGFSILNETGFIKKTISATFFFGLLIGVLYLSKAILVHLFL